MPLTPGHHPELPIDEIHVSPRNPRRISDDAFERLCYTLEKRRDLMNARPLIALPDGEVIGGNMRLKAALHLGWETIPVYVTDRVTEAERREALTLDNQPFGEWIPDELAALVAEHAGDGDDMALLGFAAAEIDDLLELANPSEKTARTPPPDDPLMKVPERAAAGDIWQLGDHRLVVGDALSSITYGKLLSDDEAARGVDLVVTSPPYNQGIENFKPSGKHKERPNVIHRLADAYEDTIDEAEYQMQQVALLDTLAGIIAPAGSVFYNHKLRYRDMVALTPMSWIRRSEKWALRQEIIWDRGRTLAYNARMFFPTDERLYWLRLADSDDFYFADEPEHRAWTSVWKNIGSGGEIKVSAPYPVELPSRAIRACCPENGIVLDPYMGTGTTLMAAEHLGRRARGIEIKPRYADVIIHRWEAYTEKTAEKIA